MNVKICCIQNIEEAALAVRHGATSLGFVSAMPSGPGPIPDEKIAKIVKTVPDNINKVLLTSQVEVEEIVQQQKFTGCNVIQLCSPLSKNQRLELKKLLPEVKLVHVIHVSGEESYQEAIALGSSADFVLLDTGSPNAKVPVLGGTGKTHDWNISKRICSDLEIPVYLAGGLNPNNVAEAINKVKPSGVDICTGVRIDYKLDETKLRAFFEQIR